MRLMHQLTLFPAFPQDSIFAKSRMSLQRHNTENLKQIFPEKELRGPRPAFLSVSDLYIPTFGLPIRMQENMWTDPGNI
jgi:hypothetical protein